LGNSFAQRELADEYLLRFRGIAKHRLGVMMITTWILAALLAEAAAGESKREVESNRIVVPVPNATMACTKEGDHLVCVIPLHNDIADELQLSASSAPKSQPYKRSPPTPALPDPQILRQLKVAEGNIELAKSLLPRASTPEEAVLAEQLLYWAKEQYRWTEALLHSDQEDLRRAPDPFDRQNDESHTQSM
jgi:hypothetical protein